MNIQRYFPKFDNFLIKEIEEKGELRVIKRQETVIGYGKYIKTLPILIKGCMKVVMETDEGQNVFLYHLNAGEMSSLAFQAALSDAKSPVNVIGEATTILLEIPIRTALNWMNTHKDWSDYIIKNAFQQSSKSLNTVHRLSFMSIEERILVYLEDKAKCSNTNLFKMPQKEVARDLNASRETVSRLLKNLEKTGKITLGRNQIQLLSQN